MTHKDANTKAVRKDDEEDIPMVENHGPVAENHGDVPRLLPKEEQACDQATD